MGGCVNKQDIPYAAIRRPWVGPFTGDNQSRWRNVIPSLVKFDGLPLAASPADEQRMAMKGNGVPNPVIIVTSLWAYMTRHICRPGNFV